MCSQRSTVNRAVASLVNGVPVLLVLIMAKLPSAFFTSHVQEEPKLFVALWVNDSLKDSNEPNVDVIALEILPEKINVYSQISLTLT